jgi:photosystem II stability/assembly factor-like uncharacterized protein
MKNFLFIYLFITLSIIVNSCDEGYKDENTITSFSIALKEVTAVPSTTTDATPDYTFSSNIAGYITHGGSCSSSTTVASQGNNKITLNYLINGTYSDCTITVDSEGSVLTGSLKLSSFTVAVIYSPTIAEVTAVTTPTSDSTPNYTFSSDQAGTITYGGSCSSSTTSAISGNNTITLNSLNDGTYSDCTIKVTNAAGYVSNSITITSFVVDSAVATLAEVTAVTTPTNDSTPNYTFSSDKAGTITYGGSCSSGTTSAISGNTTITLVYLSDGTYSDCTVTVTDTAGNSVTLNMSSFTVDTTAPSVSSFILSDTLLTTGENTVVTLVFSEVVVSFSSDDDITVDNGTLATMTSSNNITWTGTFTPLANTEEDNTTLSLGTSYTDLAGNAGPAATTANYAIDTLLPTISSVTAGWGTFLNATEDNSDGTVTVVTSGAENGQEVTVTLNSDNYTDTVFDNSTSVTVAASGLQALTDGDNYTLTTNVSDAAGNAATVNTGTSFTYDITTPMISGGVAITSATGIQNNLLNAGDNVSVTATFSKNVPVTGTPQLTLAVGDDNQTATYASSGNGGTTLVFKYTIQAGDNDTNGISIRANALALDNGTIRDLAGNNAILIHSAVDNNSSYKVDTEAPRVNSFTLSDTALKAGDNATVTLDFSEAVASFSSADDITVDNGTLATMTSSDNKTWEGTFTPLANTEEDNNTLSLATSYTDLAGNAGPAATTANYAIDTLLPTISSVTAGWGTYLNATEDNSSGTVTIVTSGAENGQTVTVALNSDNYTDTVLDNSTSVTFAVSGLQALTDGDNYTLTTNVSDAAGNAATVNTGTSFTYDITAPTISGGVAITSVTGIQNNLLNAGDNVSATVTFSEVVNKTGTPQLTLAVGDDNQTATYASGTGNAQLVFTYTIQAGDNDTNGISIRANALALDNGSTIMDLAENNAILTHDTVSDNNSYMVDTEAPRVDNFTMDDKLLTIGDNATVTLIFSEPVCADSSGCSLTQTGGTDFSSADITSLNGSLNNTMSSNQANDNKTIWTGTFTPTPDTEYDDSNRLSLATRYTDLAGNNGPVNETENYEVDTRAPTVSVAISDAATEGRLTYESGSYGFLNEGDNVSVTATFSERVIVESGTPTLPLVVGSDNRTATYTSGDNSTALVFRYTIQAGDNDSNGISILGNTLALNSSTIKDAALNNAILTHSEVSDNNGYIVDTTPPTVSSVVITSATNKQYSLVNAGDNVSVTVTFSETPISAVIVESGTATLTLVVGSANRTATLHSGSSTIVSGSDNASLVFQYTIQATGTSGENDDDGISIGANALNSNSITIMDAAGNIATDLTHSAVSDNTGYKVDTTELTVNSFTISDTLLVVGDNATVELVFSEAVCADSSVCGGVNVFSSDDINLDNATGLISTMSPNDNKTIWTGTFTPTTGREVDNNTLSLDTTYTDVAGNPGPSATTSNFEVETKAPTATFSISDTTLRLTDNATVDLVFSEAIVGFSSTADIKIPDLDQGPGQGRASGTLSTMTSSDNITWTGTFMPTFPNTEDWDNTLTLDNASYADTVGNTGSAETSEKYMVDDRDPSTHGAPTITLDVYNSGNDALLLWGQYATLTVNFQEPVTANFESDNATGTLDSFSSAVSAGDINLDNATGTLATMIPIDNDNKTTWTGTFTPTTDREVDNNTITLAASWTDQVGNPGTSVTTSNFEVETLRPTVSSFTLSDTALKAGDNATVSLVFSEAVASFSSAADITAAGTAGASDNGSLATMTSSDNITWAGTFTPPANTEEDNNYLSFDNTSYTDLAGNAGPSETTANYVVDTIAPSVSSLQLTDGVTTISTFTDRCLPVTSNIMVTFDDVMDLNYIQTNTSDTFCTASEAGSILVSSDNFNSCVRMSSVPSASNSNQTFTLDPYDNLSFYTTYKVRVTTGVKDVLGNNMSSQYDNSSGFKTSSYPSSSPISGVFVGVGQYGKAVRSIDNGTSWDNETCQILTDLNGVTSGNNTFVAVGDNGTVLRSTDNASSFSTVSPYYVGTSRGVTFGNNTFVGVSDAGRTGRSTDNGTSFSNVNTPLLSYSLNGVTFGNDSFVGVGSTGRTVRSTNDGSSWDNSTVPYPYRSLYGVTFGNNNFVGVGDSGKIVRSTDNGTTWSNSTSGITTDLKGVTFGNNTLVAVGDSGKILRSTDDGSSWENSTSGISSDLYGVTFGNDTFVAVGQSGKILRSTDDGSSWDNSTSPITTDLNGVTFSE